jgi:hypothetical protein
MNHGRISDDVFPLSGDMFVATGLHGIASDDRRASAESVSDPQFRGWRPRIVETCMIVRSKPGFRDIVCVVNGSILPRIAPHLVAIR